MTGGGSVFTGGWVDSAQLDSQFRVTHGFEIHCGFPDASLGSDQNSLEVNWGDPGNKHKFNLDKHLTWAHCDLVPAFGSPNPPAAGFNWFHGRGTGTFDNNKAPATIDFIFTDSGEPGGTNGPAPPDTALYCISSGTADIFTPSSCDLLLAAGTGTYQFDNGITPDLITYPAGIPLTYGNQQAHAN
jgi:hypothetical protein